MWALALAVSFLIPLAIAPHGSFYYDITPKVVLIFLIASAGLIFVSFRFDSLRNFTGTPLARWFAIAAGASIAASVLAALFSANASLAWNGSNWRRYGALTECATIIAALLISAFVARNKSHLRWLLRTLCAAGLIVALYGIAQYFRWDPLLSSSVYEAGEGPFQIVRPPSTMGHADYFSAFLLWPIFLGIGLAYEERGPWLKALSISAGLAGIVAVVLSGSRGALLALAAGVCVCCMALRPRLRTAISAIGLAAAAFIIFYISPGGERLRARVHWIGEDRAGGARLLLWRDSLRMAEAKPMVGFGPDNFVAEFPRFQSPALARAYPDFMHESPHNILLDALASEGILGLLGLLAVAAVAILAGIKQRTSMSAVQAALLAAFIASLAAHQFIAFTAPTAFYFYLGAGLLVGQIGSLGRVTNPLGVVVPKPRWRYVALAPAALFLTQAYFLISADASLAKVNRQLNAGDSRGAAEAYRSFLKRRSAGVSADLYFSRRWAETAATFRDAPSRFYYSQIAFGAASLASQAPEQRQNAWYNLATLAAWRGDSAAVETALRSAIAAGRNWYKPHWALAHLLSAQGRQKEAAAEASLALELNTGNAEVASTLTALPVPIPPLHQSQVGDGSKFLDIRE